MKKRIIIMTGISLLCVGMVTFATASLNDDKIRAKGAEDFYSITIKAEDVTTSTSAAFGSFVAYTDQQNNPITFNYEGIKYEQEGDNKYLVFEQDAWFANDRYSQVRKIKQVTVYGNGGVFSYNYGWATSVGSIQYTTVDRYSSANGTAISLGDREPNYFLIMHRDGEADVKISKIVFAYSKDCTPGVKPAVVLDHITLSGQKTSLNRGSTFTFGGNVIAHYNDDTTANVTTSTTFSGYNMSTAGNYTVKASYTEGGVTKTATYKLTVNKVWTSLWSGKVSSPNSTIQDVCTLNGLSGTVTLRVTWSCSASGGTGMTTTYYNNNGSTTTSTKPSNPFQFNLATGSNRLYIVGADRSDSSSYPQGKGAYLCWSASSHKFYLTGYHKTYGTGDVSCTLTITKIEHYY